MSPMPYSMSSFKDSRPCAVFTRGETPTLAERAQRGAVTHLSDDRIARTPDDRSTRAPAARSTWASAARRCGSRGPSSPAQGHAPGWTEPVPAPAHARRGSREGRGSPRASPQSQ
eukprot:197749-Rhodomonas_salina.2